jgi:3,4-dihydroxy 2-butanone 4-phosphate synthase / GTP cyclohydrolase II
MTVLNKIKEIISDAKMGKMFIMVDDEDRENEGDLIIAAEDASHDVINFMITHAKGLVCAPITQERADILGLKPMAKNNSSRFSTAFTVSVEARENITTGISPYDRAQTIKTLIDDKASSVDICSPGHIFPLIARDGGVLVRAGHTEASIDIARLAGKKPAAVICEIIKEDGTMARLPDLLDFAKKHNLKIGSTADLIAYRRRHDNLIKRQFESIIQSKFGGEFKAIIYKNQMDNSEHIALIKGEIDVEKPVLVRMHAVNILSDIIGDMSEDKQDILHKSMEIISQNGSGVVVLIRDQKKDQVSAILKSRCDVACGAKPQLRDYGIGAQILLDLGISNMILLSNNNQFPIAADGYGFNISGFKSID